RGAVVRHSAHASPPLVAPLRNRSRRVPEVSPASHIATLRPSAGHFHSRMSAPLLPRSRAGGGVSDLAEGAGSTLFRRAPRARTGGCPGDAPVADGRSAAVAGAASRAYSSTAGPTSATSRGAYGAEARSRAFVA